MVSTDPYGMNSTPIPVSITVRVVGLPRTAVVVWSIHLDHNRVAIAEDHEVWRAHPSIAETAVSRAASVASPRTHTILRDLDNDLANRPKRTKATRSAGITAATATRPLGLARSKSATSTTVIWGGGQSASHSQIPGSW